MEIAEIYLDNRNNQFSYNKERWWKQVPVAEIWFWDFTNYAIFGGKNFNDHVITVIYKMFYSFKEKTYVILMFLVYISMLCLNQF